ncbi:response regulator [Peribacillus muralis]|uniref:response regulator transcription factor n=1 Tax=Peribacillus muralis TaxID=264697 RepID=UPI001F4DCBE7|nr:response regulator [Peribacillus muralis]MCK1992154.1 response regulator [Peribacillus muralis]MCK2012710.1 response regulator [Peribacillus muralis]
MHQIFIVEDEYLARQRLKSVINESCPGLIVQAEVDNGEDAITKLKQYKPDVLVVDIKMPGCNGLEVCRFAQTLYPELPCIIISGYDDFSLVREALVIGSVDYLLKPVQEQELIQSLNKAIQKKNENHLKKQFMNISELESMFRFIQDGDTNDIPLWMEYLQKHFPDFEKVGERCFVVFDDFISREKAQKILWKYLSAVIVSSKDRMYTAIVPVTRKLKSKSMEDSIRLVKHELQREYGKSISVGYSQAFDNMDHLYERYSEALTNYEKRFYNGDDWLGIPCNEGASMESSPTFHLDTYIQAVIGTFEAEIEDVMSSLKVLFHKIKENQIPLQHLQPALSKMIRKIVYRFDEEDREEMNLQNFIPINWLQKRKNVNLLQSELSEFILSLKLFENKTSRPLDMTIKKICYYIKREYTRPEFSIVELAEKFHFNPSYLSTLFKENIGESFSDYVINIRLEKAKELLKQPFLKNYEVAYSVGYRNEKAFARAFKRKYGATPQEYRKNSPL